MTKLFRRRSHLVNLGIGERKPVALQGGVWRNSWVIELPFGLRLSRIPPGVIMTTKAEWEHRDHLIKVLMPLYWAAQWHEDGMRIPISNQVLEDAQKVVEPDR